MIATTLGLLLPDGSLRQPLDSLDVVNLYTEIESTLGLTVPAQDLVAENFASVESLAEMVRRLHLQQAPGGDGISA
jgi:acyl carrier protein